MILISCRRKFTSTVEFNKQDEIREGDVTMTEAELAEAVRGKRTLILVHGYNNEMPAVIDAYDRVREMMRLSKLLAPDPRGYDVVLGYAWPGGWSGLSFPVAVLRANRTGKRFRDTLAKLQNAAASVDVQTHSLGARVAMEALDRGGVTLRNLWLLAAAIDDETVEKGEEYFDAAQRCSRVYVMHSEQDPVLRTAYRIGDLLDHDRALGWKGPQRPKKIADSSPNTKVVNCRQVVTSHGGYRAAAECYDYWLNELLTASAPQFSELTPENRAAVGGVGH
jgi:esterase/lipase superfamily enzyme